MLALLEILSSAFQMPEIVGVGQASVKPIEVEDLKPYHPYSSRRIQHSKVVPLDSVGGVVNFLELRGKAGCPGGY